MMPTWFDWNSNSGLRAPVARPRLFPVNAPPVIYAIGDVHGCFDQLVELEEAIFADARDIEAAQSWIVFLGDWVDRGPRTSDVVDRLLSDPPRGFKRIGLAGNHEQMMTEFMSDPVASDRWLDQGGLQTLYSYGIRESFIRGAKRTELRALIDSYLPTSHRALIEHCPSMLVTEAHVLVHAGLDPGRPLKDQAEHDLLWYNDDMRETYHRLGKVVVHGHMIVSAPFLSVGRICVDTGAYLGGALTAVRITKDRPTVTISTEGGMAQINEGGQR